MLFFSALLAAFIRSKESFQSAKILHFFENIGTLGAKSNVKKTNS